ncbi:DUF1905 domain-containing protein [Dermacoccaceae bacterium W4C1]
MHLEPLQFTGEVIHWRGPAPFHFVALPPAEVEFLHEIGAEVTYGWGMIPVRVLAGGAEWETSLWPKDGGYLLPVKSAARKVAGLEIGDSADITMWIEPRGGRLLDPDEEPQGS